FTASATGAAVHGPIVSTLRAARALAQRTNRRSAAVFQRIYLRPCFTVEARNCYTPAWVLMKSSKRTALERANKGAALVVQRPRRAQTFAAIAVGRSNGGHSMTDLGQRRIERRHVAA